MALFPVFYTMFLALLVIVLLFYFIRMARGGTGLRLPPGPWALPVIGHVHHLLGKLPQHKLRDLAQRHGSVMLLRIGELPVVVASSADAAREIMKTQDLAFATRPITRTMRLVLVQGSEGFLLAPYGEDWRQLRKICTVELLSARRVQSFRAFREQEVRQLLLAVQRGGTVNMSELISSYIADSMARAIIGSRFKDRETFFRLLDQGLKLFSRPSLPDLYPSSRLAMLVSRRPRRVKQLSSSTLAFMETIIREHQAHKVDAEEEEDMVDVLLRVQREGRLNLTVNIKAVIGELFMAGSDTSSTTLQWAMSELVMNQRVMQKAQEEVRRVLEGQGRVTEDGSSKLPYLHLVIKETLRLHPPAPLRMPRECSGGPRRVLGFDVPEGTMVLINAWAIGRDPSVWDEAEEFIPERFEGSTVDFKGRDFEYTPFGAGRRMCPGMVFGLANIELALASLLYHFDWERPDGMDAADLDMAEARIARRRSDLMLARVVRVRVQPACVRLTFWSARTPPNPRVIDFCPSLLPCIVSPPRSKTTGQIASPPHPNTAPPALRRPRNPAERVAIRFPRSAARETRPRQSPCAIRRPRNPAETVAIRRPRCAATYPCPSICRRAEPAPACSTVPWTRPTIPPPPPLGSPLRWPAATTRTRRSATSTARAPSPASPSSPPSTTPRRSPKWPTKTLTSLRTDPVHQINQLTTSPDRGCQAIEGGGIPLRC